MRGKPYVRADLYKTSMCATMDETGTCKYGNRCRFAHSADELRMRQASTTCQSSPTCDVVRGSMDTAMTPSPKVMPPLPPTPPPPWVRRVQRFDDDLHCVRFADIVHEDLVRARLTNPRLPEAPCDDARRNLKYLKAFLQDGHDIFYPCKKCASAQCA